MGGDTQPLGTKNRVKACEAGPQPRQIHELVRVRIVDKKVDPELVHRSAATAYLRSKVVDVNRLVMEVKVTPLHYGK